jgi:hypothetical protein
MHWSTVGGWMQTPVSGLQDLRYRQRRSEYMTAEVKLWRRTTVEDLLIHRRTVSGLFSCHGTFSGRD